MTENASVATLLAAQVAMDKQPVNGGSVGANTAVATTTPKEMNVTVLTLTALSLAMVDAAGVVAFASKKLLDFPKGYIDIESVTANLAVTKSSAGVIAAFDGDFALGTVAAAGDATLTGTEADIIASTATPQAVAGATTAIGSKLTATTIDGMTTAADLFLNVLVDDTDHDVTTTPCNLLFTGTITLTWCNLG